MKNSVAKSRSSTFLPTLQLAKRQTFDRKNELVRNEKSNLTDTLPCMIDKLHIDKRTKERNITNKLVQAEIQEENMEHIYDLKRMTSLFDIDEMSSEELYACLSKITEDTQQPFSFLANISKQLADDKLSTEKAKKPTEIDVQIAAVAKRIESSKLLLEKAKSHVEDICLRAKQDVLSKKYDDE